MSKNKKNVVIVIGLIQLLLIVSIANLPLILENFVPGQYRAMLPDAINNTLGVRDDYLPQVGDSNVEDDAVSLIKNLNIQTETPTPTSTVKATATANSSSELSSAQVVSDVPTQAESEPTVVLPTFTPTPTPTPLPLQFKIDGLVNEPQKFNNCGPTNLTIVLNFYGDTTTQTNAANYLKPNREDRNVSPWQISDYVNEFTNLKSLTRANGNQELLQTLVASGFPVVVEKGYDPEAANAFGWYGHYLTVFGFDSTAQEYNTIDTFLGPFTDKDIKEQGRILEDGHLYSYEYMSKYWQQFNYTFYIVYEPEREEELFNILGDEFVFSEDNWRAAAERAQREVEAQPENPFAWFNLGTSLTELGKKTKNPEFYEKGAVAFDKALKIGLPSRMLWYQHGPFVAYNEIGRHQDVVDLADATLVDAGGRTIEEVYLHKGHALANLQDLRGALTAYTQALKLNENFYPAQISKDWVESILNE